MTDDLERAALERVGTVLNDKWTLERLLGLGGAAAVYAACHRNGARAAVKVLHPDLSRHKEVRERFQREGYAANKVEHPGVVKVLDDDVIANGPDKGTAYLVMELLEGESLQARVERGPPFGEREFLELAHDVLEILEAAHDRGVVHRDLKPENLFLARDAASAAVRVKVLDFGLARLLSGQSFTMHGLALGTPSFMSPEQAAGRIAEIDGRTDLFALAATGFRLRTGRRIHEVEDPVGLVLKMAQSPAPRIRSIAPDASAPFARVVDRALQFKRNDRYKSAAAMRADVDRALAELDAGARPSRSPPRRPAETREDDGEPAAARTEDVERRTARNDEDEPHTVRTDEVELTVRSDDAERPTARGLDESIRIPKTGSIWPWLALLLAGGVGVALWHEDPSRRALSDTLTTWSHRLLPPVGSSVVREAPALEPRPTVSVRGPADAGTPRTASTTLVRPAATPFGTAPYGSTPARNGPGLRNPPRSH